MTDDDYRARDLDLREKDIQTRNAELQVRRDELQRERKPLSLTNAAVWVTIIAGLSGVLFAGITAYTALVQRDADGLRLFVESQDKFASCPATTTVSVTAVSSSDPKPMSQPSPSAAAAAPSAAAEAAAPERSVAEENLQMLTSFYPDLKPQFEEVVYTKYQTCIGGAAQAAYTAAKAENVSPAAAIAAADNARYAAMSATALPSAAATSTAKLPTVYIQYTTQKDQAQQLQAALQGQGYNVPGIQHVVAAPTNPEVRFYYSTQSKEAGDLATAISKILNTSPPAAHSIGKSYANLPQETLEYWFPAK
jgi:hypothetical protein